VGDECDYYIRQLRDWKGSADIEGMTTCGHGALGADVRLDPRPRPRPLGRQVAIAAYLGSRMPSTERSRSSRSPTPTRTSATTGR
jgi:hypothetical protein